MRTGCILLVAFCASSIFAQEAQPICKASNLPGVEMVQLAATGRMFEKAIILVDYSCPQSPAGVRKLPLLVKVEENIKVPIRYKKLIEGLQRSPDIIFQATIRGKLRCVGELKLRISEDGQDVVGGNGFGHLGRCRCSLSEAELIEINRLN